MKTQKNIGFVSTRFAGTDGVSLESMKWAGILEQENHRIFWYSGKSDRHPRVSYCIPEAHFAFSENVWLNQRIWGKYQRERAVTDRIRTLSNYLKSTLYRFIEDFEIDVLVAENAITIPMHVPLGIAIAELISETGIPTIAHHHDFFWERDRFRINAVRDYLDMAFPPSHPHIGHVVINEAAQRQLSLRKGTGSMLIPNVFEFEESPPSVDGYSEDVRSELGLTEDDIFVLQPTRVVPRKGIEHAIRLLGRLKDSRYKLVVSHEAGDEGHEYKEVLEQLAREEEVDVRFVSGRVGEVRRIHSDGRKIYTLWDLYPHADLVTYPSLYEGFGNALVEAIYFRKPVVVNRYSVFIRDIEPKGFRVLTMDGFVSRSTATEVEALMENPELCREMVDHNYKLGAQYYGYNSLREKLRVAMQNLPEH